jgi:hypothetical protein
VLWANVFTVVDTLSESWNRFESYAYRTALTKSQALLKSPLSYWESVDVREQHRLFYFIFEEKLPYSKKDAYWTANSVSTTRIFEQLAVQNAPDVEVGRIELPSRKLSVSDSTKRSAF